MAGQVILYMRTLLLMIALGGGASRALAAASVSLPLEGYYRPGKYMPVRIAPGGQNAAVSLLGTGSITTHVELTGNGDVIVPWLVVSPTPTKLRCESSTDGPQSIQPSLRALNENERLVGVAGAEPHAAMGLFPASSVIPVAVDTSRALLEPPQAWQSLDGIVLGAAAAARLSSHQIQVLLAGGTTIAVAAAERPDSIWPWVQTGGLWVLRPVSTGATFGIEPDAYAPTYDWDRGWPASFRAQIVFAGAIFCILSTAVLLWRSRYTVWIFVGVCAVAIALIGCWSTLRSPVLEKSTECSARANELVQHERWSFRSPLRAAAFEIPASGPGLIGPVFASGGQLADLNLQLECNPDGEPSRFRAHLEQGQSLAFLTRVLRPDTMGH